MINFLTYLFLFLYLDDLTIYHSSCFACNQRRGSTLILLYQLQLLRRSLAIEIRRSIFQQDCVLLNHSIVDIVKLIDREALIIHRFVAFRALKIPELIEKGVVTLFLECFDDGV